MTGRKQFVYLPDRTVTVEDGTVRDLDGNELGHVGRNAPGWDYWVFGPDGGPAAHYGGYETRNAAVAALLTDPACPEPGPNRYDRPARSARPTTAKEA